MHLGDVIFRINESYKTSSFVASKVQYFNGVLTYSFLQLTRNQQIAFLSPLCRTYKRNESFALRLMAQKIEALKFQCGGGAPFLL